jgi:hypothetical protein
MGNSDCAHTSVIMKKWVVRDPDQLVKNHMLYQSHALVMAIYQSQCSELFFV